MGAGEGQGGKGKAGEMGEKRDRERHGHIKAQSTLGEDIFVQKYVYEKFRKFPNFTNLPKMIIAQKYFFFDFYFWEDVPHRPPSPTPGERGSGEKASWNRAADWLRPALPYGITQCYLPPDTGECIPP